MIYIQGTSLVSKGRDKEITTAIRGRLRILAYFREANIRLSPFCFLEKEREHMRQERVNRETYVGANDNDESAVAATSTRSRRKGRVDRRG